MELESPRRPLNIGNYSARRRSYADFLSHHRSKNGH
jgi:hypothetical protein